MNMTNCRKVLMMVLTLAMLSAVTGFADTMQNLNQHMWTWAVMEEVIAEATHASYGSMPVLSPKEAEETMMAAQRAIEKIVVAIKAPEDMKAARKIADDFVAMGDQHEYVGKAVHRLLDRQENFLKAHQGD